MKRFRFRLQRVLDFRNSLKKEQGLQLAKRNAELLTEQETLEGIVAEHEQSTGQAGGVHAASELKQVRDYGQRLQKRFVEQRQTVQEATQAAEDARLKFVEKSVDAEVFTNLKERKLHEFKEEVRRAEQKELDKLVVQRFRQSAKTFDRNSE